MLSLPIPHPQRVDLQKAGLFSVADVCSATIADLRRILGVSEDVARGIHAAAGGDAVSRATVPSAPASAATSPALLSSLPDAFSLNGVSAWDLLRKKQSLTPIVTFSHSLDRLLSGGVPRGCITEFCGTPGVGKTQIAMQLCVNASIPAHLRGIDATALYMDTEGSFSLPRIRQMAAALVAFQQSRTPPDASCAVVGDPPTSLPPSQSATVESVLQRIDYCRMHDLTEQLAMVHCLGTYLSKHPRCKLVVIDSVAFHFRHSFTDSNFSTRTKLLTATAQKLAECAERYDAAIVLINQMTTRFSAAEKAGGDAGAHLVPALGDSWGHACTHRILLEDRTSRRSGQMGNGQQPRRTERMASILKSPFLPTERAFFQITGDGVRDVPTQDDGPEQTTKDDACSDISGERPDPASTDGDWLDYHDGDGDEEQQLQEQMRREAKKRKTGTE